MFIDNLLFSLWIYVLWTVLSLDDLLCKKREKYHGQAKTYYKSDSDWFVNKFLDLWINSEKLEPLKKVQNNKIANVAGSV